MNITRRQAFTATAAAPLALLAPSRAAAMPRLPLASMRPTKLSMLAADLRHVAQDWPDLEPVISEPLLRVVEEAKTRIAENETEAILLHLTETGDLAEYGDGLLDNYYARRF